MGNYKRKTDITCEICGYQCGNGYLQRHLKLIHKITKDEYLSEFPNAIIHTKEFIENRRKAVSKEMYNRWQDKEYRSKMVKVLNENAHNVEYREKLINKVRGIKYGPRSAEFKKEHSDRMKLKWQNKIYRNNWYNGFMHSNKRFKSVETRKKLSKSTTNLWNTPEYREKVLNRQGNTHSKHYIYENRFGDILKLMSLQELRVAYLLDLCDINYVYGGNKIKCFDYYVNNKKHKYIPDFQVNNIFIEVKPNGWQLKYNTWEKLETVQLQNNITLYVYDDDYLDDYMPKISRGLFLHYADKCVKDKKLKFVDLYNKIGDVRNGNFI